MGFVVLIVMLVLGAGILYKGRPYLAWVIPLGFGFVVWGSTGPALPFLFGLALLIFGSLAILFGVTPLRQMLITRSIMRVMTQFLPRISDTERLALEAGTVWWDGDLFSGNPDWNKLARFPITKLSAEEQAFLDGPVEKLCAMIDTFQAGRQGDLSPTVWDFIKEQGFFGIIIPRDYGGLGFSALAHSAIVTKVASRSTAASVTVMVPNSLGPAELILHYGTDDQKDHYLPRLARAEEIPAFALTEPEAGSDAASGRSTGVVCQGTYLGEEVLGMRLNWNKRYITLAPVATLLGLSFRLLDPDGLLGDKKDFGITCALVPADTPGVEVGLRHDPLGVPFLNGPTTGEDVFVPIDFIIGGRQRAGDGWRMLMETLAAGRGISLPALSVGAAEMSARVSGAYTTVREQFGVSICKFEGVEERLGRIGAFAYTMNAARVLTASSIDSGEKPAVITAIVKAYLTEMMRTVVNDAMDLCAGAGISKGPRNSLALAYASVPIGITVEGANILTRSLIIFGQGAIRCHPWVLEEIQAVADEDLARFDRAFFKHIGFTASNGFRSLVLGLSAGRLGRPALGGPLQGYLGQLTRMSAAFTFLSDLAMATLGGNLKRREMISGRMADALAWMYLCSATLKRYIDDGHPQQDEAFARWSCEYGLFQIQTALDGVFSNFPVAWVKGFRPIIFPLGARLKAPSDRLTQEVARQLTDGREGRERLTTDIFVPPAGDPGLGQLEDALRMVVLAFPLEKKLKVALKDRRLKRVARPVLLEQARDLGILTEEEFSFMQEVDAARNEAIQVDAFPPDFFGFDEGREEPTRAQA